MNVGEMRKLIESVPDNVRLYTIEDDHEVREVWFSDWFTAMSRRRSSQFFSDKDLMDGETKVRALVSDG